MSQKKSFLRISFFISLTSYLFQIMLLPKYYIFNLSLSILIISYPHLLQIRIIRFFLKLVLPKVIKNKTFQKIENKSNFLFCLTINDYHYSVIYHIHDIIRTSQII